MSLYDPDLAVGSKLERALVRVGSERIRQERLKSAGRYTYTCADRGMDEGEKLACLMEELGEVSRNVLARKNLVTDGETTDKALATELCQVAALAVAWIESLR